MPKLERHERGYIQSLLERLEKDPEGLRKELEAKEHLSQPEFVILDAIRRSENIRQCKYCGRPFIPNWKTQNFCGKTCRTVFHTTKYKRRMKEFFRKRNKWKATYDEEYRRRWMARINKLRVKAGRLPYWNEGENRPYTKEELEWMKRTGNVITGKGSWMAWERYLEYLRVKPPSKEPNWKVTVVLPKRTEEPKPERKPEPQKHFVVVHQQILGTEATSKVEIKPNSNCKHRNILTVTLFNGKQAFLCCDCGALRFRDEGIEGEWRYFANDVEVWL